MTQEIVLGLTGQTFHYDPPELGRPSSPTVAVYLAGTDDDGATEAATTGAASVDAVNTTLSASASAGANTLAVTLATGITKGRRYLLTATDGQVERIEVMAIAGTSVVLRKPLFNDFASGSTFQGCRISIAIDSTWVADKQNITDNLTAGYRLRWAYTALAVATIGVTFADLVRYQSKNLVTALDVDQRFPGWIDRLGPDHQEDQGASVIEASFTAVRFDCMGDAEVLRRIRSTDVIRELVICKANQLAIERQIYAGSGNLDALKTATEHYERRYAQLLREPKVAVDQGGGGASGEATRLPVWRR